MDKCFFIASEIACMQVDDFLNLPYEQLLGRVVAPVSASYERHSFMFRYTH